jgi:two-component system response regulator RegA
MFTRSPLLIIDDERRFSAQLAEHFRSNGVATETASDSAAAVRLLDAVDDPYRIVLEPNLPGTSWYHLLHLAVRAARPYRIVVVTAFWSHALAREANRLGVRYCLPKPVAPASLPGLMAEGEAPVRIEAVPWPEHPMNLALVEWEHLNAAIRQCAGNMAAAARLLGIHRPTLYKKLRKSPILSAPALR